MDGLLTLYIATSIFGIGVTLVDIFGILGSQSSDDNSGDGGESSGDEYDGSSHVNDSISSYNDEGENADDTFEDESSNNEGSLVAHDNIKNKKNFILKLFSFLRTIVYFSFGFGPVGWIVFSTGQKNVNSLFYSIPTGIIFAVIGRLLRRLQTHELDSQVKDSELLMEKAEVLVTISNGELGKVRVYLDNTYVERYAKTKNIDECYTVGTEVRVVDITDQYLIVSDDS